MRIRVSSFLVVTSVLGLWSAACGSHPGSSVGPSEVQGAVIRGTVTTRGSAGVQASSVTTAVGGGIRVSVMGTSLSITSNNPRAYTYSAELIGADKPVPVRSCTLPANGRLSFEHWPQKASGVRIGNFKVAAKDGSCP